jgi:Zn-finger nucleic acid-binding protein
MNLAVEEPSRRCPADGSDMTKIKRQGVVVDVCQRCHGVWLDPGEIHLLSKGYEDFDLKVDRREREAVSSRDPRPVFEISNNERQPA